MVAVRRWPRGRGTELLLGAIAHSSRLSDLSATFCSVSTPRLRNDTPARARLRDSFVALFGPGITGAREGFPGHVWWLAEDVQGVQWNAWIDDDTRTTYLGVNLEGLTYVDWPVARLIERELAESALFKVVATIREPSRIEAVWRRDVWKARERLEVRELYVAPTPIPLSALTESLWTQALVGARGCLNPNRGYRGRATGTFTLLSGERERHEVSPHLQFRTALPNGLDGNDHVRAMKAARRQLEPLHAFVQTRAS